MDKVEKNLDKKLEEKSNGNISGQQDLLKTIMERTARLESRVLNETSPEVAKLMAETKKLEQRQKDYLEWKTVFSEKLDKKIDNSASHGEQTDAHLKTTNGNIEQFMLSIVQIRKRCEESATMNQ
eukprot:6454232-Ditylum_brightwellii.AAC.1